MRLSFGTYSIQLTTYTSRRELETALRTAGGLHEVVNLANGEGNAFYGLKFVSEIGNPEGSKRHIGLCACRTGIEPQILLNAASELVYLGLDSTLLIFSIPTGLIKPLTLDSPFYWMSLFTDPDMILLLHEIGLLCLSTKGDVLWSYDASDIITSVMLVAPQTLKFSYLEGSGSTLDLATGKILDQTDK